MQKPVRAVRRFVRRNGKGKGKGKGKAGKGGQASAYLASLPDPEVESVFKGKSKGKGKGTRSSGKGKGRSGNPLGPDGEPMACHDCGSTEHLVRECPQRAVHGRAPQPPTTFYAAQSPDAPADEGPLAGVVPSAAPVATVFMVSDAQSIRNTPNVFPDASTNPVDPPATTMASQPAPPPTWAPPPMSRTPDPLWSNPWTPDTTTNYDSTPPLAPDYDAPTTYAPLATAPMELPPWATMPGIGYASGDAAARAWTVQPLQPLFSGVAGSPSATSSLTPPQQGAVEQQLNADQSLELWYTQGVAPPVRQTLTSSLDRQHHSFIDQFWAVQQQHEPPRRTREPDAPEPARSPPPEIYFEGDDRICTICLEEFEQDDRVVRLICRHLFHIHCWNDVLISTRESLEECPNCRGSARISARFRYIAPPVEAYVPPPTGSAPTVHPINTPAGSNASSFVSILPWYPSKGQQPQGYFHASTHLPGGRLGAIVDPGAWTNLCGRKMARRIAEAAVAAGHEPTQRKMGTPLGIQGVGNGTQECRWETSLPVAVPSTEGGANLHLFETPTVDGNGEDLPCILGLRSMREKQGVLEMAEEKEMLSVPGPGGYKIEWSPGTLHVPLQNAPSGHLVMPVDHYDKVAEKPKGGLKTEGLTFHATQRQSTNPTARSSWDPAPAPAPTPPTHHQ